MSGDPMAAMESRIVSAIEASEKRLGAAFLAALGQRTAEIMAKLASVQSDSNAAMVTGLDVNRKIRDGRNELSGLDERLDAAHRRISTLTERLDALEDNAGKASPPS
jgi:hypothetical protein